MLASWFSSGCNAGISKARAAFHILFYVQAQKKIFRVGEDMHAITITANGHALQSAAAQGVHIEAFVHKAMWLTGL